MRYHAWQSSLVFAVVFIFHVIFSWSAVISWIMFVGDLGLIAWLTFRAYKDGKLTLLDCAKGRRANNRTAETLDRYELPFFGRLANQILDDE